MKEELNWRIILQLISKMNLEKILKKTIVRKLPTHEVLSQVKNGNKFIIVQEDFDNSLVPLGYTLINMKYKGDSFRALIPQSLLFYMANPGEGDSGKALDDIADFYGETENYEEDAIREGSTSVQETNWATLARSSYDSYLINQLVKHKNGEGDRNGEPIPEFNCSVLNQLDLNDEYVAQRVRAMAAVALGKTTEEVREYDIGDLLKHVTLPISGQEQQISPDEFKKITKKRLVRHWDAHTKIMRCLADSHYDLKPEYQNDSEWDYDLRTLNKRKKNITITQFDSKIAELESDILRYRQGKHGRVGRHDQNLIRQYVNLAHIAKENPRAQLDIQPPKELKGEIDNK